MCGVRIRQNYDSIYQAFITAFRIASVIWIEASGKFAVGKYRKITGPTNEMVY